MGKHGIVSNRKFVETNKVSIVPYFTDSLKDAFDSVEWELRTAEIKTPEGKVLFKEDNLEFPKSWSQNCTSLVAEKYFRFVLGKRETSVKHMISRVAETISQWGKLLGYFDDNNASNLCSELKYILVNQMAAFNSPVWFNIGTTGGKLRTEQMSACFINSIEDSMSSILELAKIEGLIYKGGSGSGVNYSKLRSSKEKLSGGGYASGPVSFIAKDDFNAGAIKSGGTTRRAAKINILNIDHGDILEFIRCKALSEKAAHALVDAGFSSDFRDKWGAYALIPFQNGNNSVRVTDDFMSAVERDLDWELKARDGSVLETVKARFLWDEICKSVHACGDPGLQFDTIINDWNTCPKSGRIDASNPCQPAFAPVLTPEGISTIGNIDVGHVIWSGNAWTRIKRKIFTGIKPVYKYHTHAGSFIGTNTHKVFSNGERVEVRFADTIDTSVNKLEKIPCEDFNLQAVVDGLVLGDGGLKISNCGSCTYYLLYIGEEDQSYFDSDIAGFITKKPFDEKAKAHRVKTTLSNDELPRTYNRKIPDRYFYGGFKEIRSLLRGLYSANGSIIGPRITLKASSFNIIDRVQQMLSALGIRSYYTTNKAHNVEFSNGIYECKESYDLNINSDRIKFQKLIGFIQPYKQKKLNKICSTILTGNSKISYEVVSQCFLGEMPVWDIEVEDTNHSYWTGGLLVSNCIEFMFLDDAACNLASINILKFLEKDTDSFDIGGFVHTIDVLITAMEIMVDAASYPTQKIQDNSNKFRPLGLGYTNLGAFLMAQGISYDSTEGREQAAYLTALMTARAYAQSARLAKIMGPFPEYQKNKDSMLSVIKKHKDNLHMKIGGPLVCNCAGGVYDRSVTPILKDSACKAWEVTSSLGKRNGFRNSQVTLLAPSGTVSFLMDCDTTGIEPELSLSKTKKLVGGGTINIVNQQVPCALRACKYSEFAIKEISDYVTKTGSIVGAPGLNEEHLSIFDSSIPEPIKGRFLRPESHILMMAAVQPFLSGAISKTCNIPSNSTVEDISHLYFLACEVGLKSVILYRDKCKKTQPLQIKEQEKVKLDSVTAPSPLQTRKKLPNDCISQRHKFTIGMQEGYIHVGLYPDGKPGEVFIRMAKQGTTMLGLMDSIGILTSIALQYGVPISVLVNKFAFTCFEPAGMTDNPNIKFAGSPLDYLFRWLGMEFDPGSVPEQGDPIHSIIEGKQVIKDIGNICMNCGNPAQRTGVCISCPTCGWNQGCG